MKIENILLVKRLLKTIIRLLLQLILLPMTIGAMKIYSKLTI